MQSDVGDIVLYLHGNRPSAELLCAIWNVFCRKYRARLPVNITTDLKFSRPNAGVDEGVLLSKQEQVRKRPRTTSFKKMSGGGNRISIILPDDSAATDASAKSYI